MGVDDAMFSPTACTSLCSNVGNAFAHKCLSARATFDHFADAFKPTPCALSAGDAVFAFDKVNITGVHVCQNCFQDDLASGWGWKLCFLQRNIRGQVIDVRTCWNDFCVTTFLKQEAAGLRNTVAIGFHFGPHFPNCLNVVVYGGSEGLRPAKIGSTQPPRTSSKWPRIHLIKGTIDDRDTKQLGKRLVATCKC